MLLTSVAVGGATAAGYGVEALVALVAAGATAVGAAYWRAAVLGLVLYIPVSGIVIVAAYPNTAAATLVKDFLFVLPAYLGFAAWTLRSRVRVAFPGAPAVLFALIALLVVSQMLNPGVPNVLVGAIGAKVWLLYLPLYFLGFHFARSFDDVCTLLRVMCVAAIIPVVVGIAEAVLIYAGSAGTVYALYGDAAASVTQNFAALEYPGGGVLWRVPSTFSFVTQYFGFLLTMAAVAYAWWRIGGSTRKQTALRGALWLAVLAAAFLSGARTAFLFIPVLVVLMLVLDRRGQPLAPITLATVGAVFAAAAAAIGTNAGGAAGHTFEVAKREFAGIFVDGFAHAFSTTWLGLGTGTNTNATRYAYAENRVGGVDGYWYESWHVKITLELGVVGLVLVGLLIGAIIVRGLSAHRVLTDPRLRALSAAILAFLIVNVGMAVKGQFLDFDPINVYFWLLAGLLARLPFLDVGTNGGAK